MKKRLVLGLLTAITAVMLAGCSKNQGGQDTPYPYSWKENRDGSVELTINGETEEGYTWTAESSYMLQTDKTETGFTITPLTGDAAGVVSFTCQTDGSLPEQVYKITLSLKADEKGRLEVLDDQNEALEGNASAEEKLEIPCQWRYDGEKGLLVYVTTADRSWKIRTESQEKTGEDGNAEAGSEAVSENAESAQSEESASEKTADSAQAESTAGEEAALDSEMEYPGTDQTGNTYLSVMGPDYDENGFLVTIRGTEQSAAIILEGLESSRYIRLEIQIDDTGEGAIVNCSEGTLERTKEDMEGMSELEEQFGTVEIPEGTAVVECRTEIRNDEENADAVLGTVYYQKNGNTWSYTIAENITLEQLIQEATDEDPDQLETGETDGISVALYSMYDKSFAFWQESSTRVCMLCSGESKASESMLNETQSWIGAQQNG